ncbi:hypothetical protein [Candidatus Merdisoma sp. JLR.KK006]|uniref:hypothetical protein n=1 Tax=Candidatus Merdisoma sp. JLR.KK006 TaxID=3112626 RepID=UPI002FF2F958
MPKRLTGSAGTGKKIMQNQNLFKYTYTGSEQSGTNLLYKFDWSFDNYQSGNISIKIRPDGTIDESSLINCRQNPREFSRPLGAYNDRSLYNVFRMILDHQHISNK